MTSPSPLERGHSYPSESGRVSSPREDEPVSDDEKFDQALRELSREVWRVVEPVPVWVAERLTRLLTRGRKSCMTGEGRSLSPEVASPSAWPVRICCGDGTVWDEMPDDLGHAFALIEDYDKTCGCERPGEHYVERTRPAVWERVTAPARVQPASKGS